ncbi:MAG TPA: amidase family protein [Chloroflexota bacterium]|nr:amidase family protein [Chloroflexota bacterium]
MSRDAITPYSAAADMLAALNAGSVTSRDLVDLCVERMRRYNGELHCIATPNFDGAAEAAEHADRRRARGEAGRLLGLPLTVKDCIAVRGLPATGGVLERARAISPRDAPPIHRVREAGAVILATTNVPPYASDWQSHNDLFGRAANPWDLGRTPGGSTGGGAAAVAAGLTPLEMGGDYIGSIRIPSAFCGIFGHKPSYSAVPGTGHFPLAPLPNPVPPFAVIGPLARSARDLELALDVAAGPDIGEEPAWRLTIPRARHEVLAGYRVAILPSIPWLPVERSITGVLERLAEQLRSVGATVERAQPLLFGDLRDHHKLYVRFIGASTSGRRPPEVRQQVIEELRATGDEFQVAMASGLEAIGGDIGACFLLREDYRAAYREFFRDWDILLAPVFPVNAFPHTTLPEQERFFDVDGVAVPYDRGGVYPGLANLSGQPATAFPAGLTGDGLPIGLQAIGPYLEDRTPIRFAQLVTEAFGGFVPPPDFP